MSVPEAARKRVRELREEIARHDHAYYVLDDGLQVIWTPGHTPGSIAVQHAERGLLFTGDTAAEREGAVFLGPFNIDRERAKESFRRLALPGITTVSAPIVTSGSQGTGTAACASGMSRRATSGTDWKAMTVSTL
jgi:glyoxylase-like metal-dependent hydrolase (beta-lactamase superfamily II)